MSINPERRAWQVLLVSFGAFLILCVTLLYGAQWFVFRSTIPLTLNLTAARGTVRVILPNTQDAIAVTGSRSDLEQGVVIQTDPTSQALLSLSDPRSGVPVASLVLFRDSQVRLTTATAPRFNLSRLPYRIQVEDTSGRYQILVLPINGQTVQFDVVASPLLTQMRQSGQYLFELHDDRMRIVAYAGEMQILDTLTNTNLNVHAYETLLALGEDASTPHTPQIAGSRSLVTDSRFGESTQSSWDSYTIGEPAANVSVETIEGRSAVVFDRSQANWPDLTLSHAEAGIVQSVETNVNQFNQIELRLTFLIAEQSLSTCGIVGSECPMMVRIVYVDTSGVVRTYIHGFYATHNPGLGYPLLCDTCRTEHERVNLGSWYTFSDNLMTLIPADQRPSYIREIGVYASGHAFKVYLAEVDLVASE